MDYEWEDVPTLMGRYSTSTAVVLQDITRAKHIAKLGIAARFNAVKWQILEAS